MIALKRFAIVLALFSLSTIAESLIKFPFAGETGDIIEVGATVKIVDDNTLALCDQNEIPVGIVIAVETFPAEPDSYCVASSGVAVNVPVLAGRVVSAGDKLVPADGGTVQALSSNLEGYVIGVSAEDGSGGDRIKVIIDVSDTANGKPKAESPSFKLYRSY